MKVRRKHQMMITLLISSQMEIRRSHFLSTSKETNCGNKVNMSVQKDLQVGNNQKAEELFKNTMKVSRPKQFIT